MGEENNEAQDMKQVTEIEVAPTIESTPTAERDLMDGGFAVVDRERLIAEETKVIVPWYKNLINIFIAPTAAMEETIEADPPKGIGLGLLWATLFAALYTLTYSLNPLQKAQIYDLGRKAGMAEDKLAQYFQLSMISGTVTAIITVALGALMTAVVLQIIKAICRDKGKFKKLYIIALFSQVVAFALNLVDNGFKYLVGTINPVLGVASLMSAEAIKASPLLQTLANTVTVPNIWALIVMVIGYQVMTKKSTVKAVVVVAIYELLMFGMSYGIFVLQYSALSRIG